MAGNSRSSTGKRLVNPVSLIGKKRGLSSSKSMYRLKIFSFSKSYDTKWDKGPLARSGHRIECNDRSMFAIGGYNPSVAVQNLLGDTLEERATVFHEIWRFDFDTNTWTQLDSKNMTSELASCATAMSGNLMFLYGGTGCPFGNKINEDVFACNLFTSDPVKEFKKIDIVGSTKPPKQYGQSIVVSGKYLYTVGGTDGFVYSMDVYRLDLQTRVWEKLTMTIDGEGPPPRYRQEVVLYQDYLIILGGGTSDETFDFEKLPAFKLRSRQWEYLETTGDETRNYEFPESRRCHACVQDPRDAAVVFVNGGLHETVAFADTWRLDLRTRKWRAIAQLSLPRGLFFHSAAVTPDGKMAVYGGVVSRKNEMARTSDVYTSWIAVPMLKHACWEALLFYVKNGAIRVPNADLRRLGLPPHLRHRLERCL